MPRKYGWTERIGKMATLEVFRDIFVAMFEEGSDVLTDKLSERGGEMLSTINFFTNQQHLSKCLKTDRGSFGNYLIHLNPPSGSRNKTFGLWSEWDLSNEVKPKCKIEVMYMQSRSEAFGFRVEGPHGRSKKHKLWHAQVMHSFCKEAKGAHFPTCSATWIDVHMPAFPVSLGEDRWLKPIDVAGYAALCLYGKDLSIDLRDKFVSSVGLDDQIRSMVSGTLAP